MATNMKYSAQDTNQVNLVPINLNECRSANEAHQKAFLKLKQHRCFFIGGNHELINAQRYLRKIANMDAANFSESKEQEVPLSECWGESHLLALSFQAYTAGWFRAWIVVADVTGDVLTEITDLLVPYKNAPKGYVQFSLSEDLLNDLNPLCGEDCYAKVTLRLQGQINVVSRINTLIVNR